MCHIEGLLFLGVGPPAPSSLDRRCEGGDPQKKSKNNRKMGRDSGHANSSQMPDTSTRMLMLNSIVTDDKRFVAQQQEEH